MERVSGRRSVEAGLLRRGISQMWDKSAVPIFAKWETDRYYDTEKIKRQGRIAARKEMKFLWRMY